MKTKDLIAFLLKVDPNGEAEIMVENRGVTEAVIDPMHYDGIGVLPIFDEQKDVVGIKLCTEGLKINLRSFDLKEVFLYNEEPIVDMSKLSDSRKEDWMKRLEKIKSEMTAKREEYHNLFYGERK